MSAPHTFIRPEILWQTIGLKAGQTVIHLGCGPGFYLIPAAKIVGPSGKAIGVDIRPDMVAEAASRATREGVGTIVQTIHANGEDMKPANLPEGSADWVLLVNILHQSHPAKVIGEARQLMKPAGHVIVISWSTAATPFGPPLDNRLSVSEMNDILTAAKLKVVKNFTPSPYHYGLIAAPL